MGMAMNTPRHAVRKTKPVMTCQGIFCPLFTMRSAAQALPTTLPVLYPADDAVDCMQLFSRMLISERWPPLMARSPFQNAQDNTQAVMATPKAQPIFSVV